MSKVRAGLSFDDMLDAVADVQRRRVLIALLDHDPQDDPPVVVIWGESGSTERFVTMNHVHLPKLADHGFIEWDKNNQEVAKGPNFDEIRPLLELLDNNADELPDDWL